MVRVLQVRRGAEEEEARCLHAQPLVCLQGSLRKGLRCKLYATHPSNGGRSDFTVFEIRIRDSLVESAPAGSLATLLIKNFDFSGPLRCIRHGDVAGLASDDTLQPAFAFQALVLPELRALKLGSLIHMNLHAARCTVRIAKILWSGKNTAPDQTEAPARKPAEVLCVSISQ
jgi:hypothetical protein